MLDITTEGMTPRVSMSRRREKADRQPHGTGGAKETALAIEKERLPRSSLTVAAAKETTESRPDS